jgi:hypothetical protein
MDRGERFGYQVEMSTDKQSIPIEGKVSERDGAHGHLVAPSQ